MCTVQASALSGFSCSDDEVECEQWWDDCEGAGTEGTNGSGCSGAAAANGVGVGGVGDGWGRTPSRSGSSHLRCVKMPGIRDSVSVDSHSMRVAGASVGVAWICHPGGGVIRWPPSSSTRCSSATGVCHGSCRGS